MWHSLSSAQDELARSLNSFTRRTEAELTAARARLAEVESLQQLISSASKGDAASLFEIYQKAIKSNRYGTTDHLVAGVNRLPFLFAAAALNHVEALELVAYSALDDLRCDQRDQLVMRSPELAYECWRRLAALGHVQYRHKVLERDLYSRVAPRSQEALAELRRHAEEGCADSAKLMGRWFSAQQDHHGHYVWESVAQALGAKERQDLHRIALAMSARTMPHGYWKSDWLDRDLTASARRTVDAIVTKARKARLLAPESPVSPPASPSAS
jgi:hypothetical protein